METAKTNKRVTVGVGLLLAVTLVLGWFVGRFVPGEPQSPQPEPSDCIYPSSSATYIPIAEVDEVPFKSVAKIEGLVQGYKYMKTHPVATRKYEEPCGKNLGMVVEEVETVSNPALENYDIVFPSFEISVDGARAVSFDAFAEWYPDFIERGGGKASEYVPELSKIVLADVTVTNLSDDQALQIDRFRLASDAFNQISPGCLGDGSCISTRALESMNDAPHYQARKFFDFFSLVSVEPRETRAITLPYVVSSSYFTDVADYDELDLARFSLEIGDYATGTLYRFALA